MPLPGHRLLALVSLPYFSLGAVSMDFAGGNRLIGGKREHRGRVLNMIFLGIGFFPLGGWEI